LEAAVESSDEQEQFALSIELDEDVVGARQQGRELARTLGFSGSQSLLVVTAISELARNIIRHAGAGEILLAAIQNGHRQGLRITALDRGPGIANVNEVLSRPGTTQDGCCFGLSGLKEIVDDFEIASRPGGGTRVVTTIWA